MLSRNKRKLAFMLSIIMALLVFIAGCGGATNGEEDEVQSNGEESDGEITLNFVGYNYHDENKMERILERWNEENPHIKVNYKDFPAEPDEYFPALDLAIAGNEPMDVMLMQQNEIGTFAKSGRLLEINTLAEADDFDLVDNFGEAINNLKIDGKNYMLPYNKVFNMLYFNKDMFDAKNLDYPDETTTYDELGEMAKELASGSGDDAVFGYAQAFRSPSSVFAPAIDHGWNFVTEDGTPNFDDPKVKKMLAWYKDLVDADAAPSAAIMELEEMDSRLEFARGQVAMVPANWWAPVLWNMRRFDEGMFGDEHLDFDIGVTWLPKFEDDSPEKVAEVTLQWGYAIHADSEHPEEAYQFAKFIVTEAVDIMANAPAYTKSDPALFTDVINTYLDNEGELHEDIYPPELVEQMMEVMNEVEPREDHYDVPYRDPAVYEMLKDLYETRYGDYFLENADLDEFIQQLQEEAESREAAMN